jgi:hypothetical protein
MLRAETPVPVRPPIVMYTPSLVEPTLAPNGAVENVSARMQALFDRPRGISQHGS